VPDPQHTSSGRAQPSSSSTFQHPVHPFSLSSDGLDERSFTPSLHVIKPQIDELRRASRTVSVERCVRFRSTQSDPCGPDGILDVVNAVRLRTCCSERRSEGCDRDYNVFSNTSSRRSTIRRGDSQASERSLTSQTVRISDVATVQTPRPNKTRSCESRVTGPSTFACQAAGQHHWRGRRLAGEPTQAMGVPPM